VQPWIGIVADLYCVFQMKCSSDRGRRAIIGIAGGVPEEVREVTPNLSALSQARDASKPFYLTVPTGVYAGAGFRVDRGLEAALQPPAIGQAVRAGRGVSKR
jgi:hypothetical protein